MGSMQEMERLLRSKDDIIKDLQKLLEEKDEKIMQLRSKLDKFQSILPQTQNNLIVGPRKQRAQGISAESQSVRSLEDFSKASFRKYSKTDRYVYMFWCVDRQQLLYTALWLADLPAGQVIM